MYCKTLRNQLSISSLETPTVKKEYNLNFFFYGDGGRGIFRIVGELEYKQRDQSAISSRARKP